MAEEEESSVEVYVRLRPAHGGQGESDVSISRRFGQQKHVQVRNLEFSLDWVFDESASQEEVFEKVGANLPMLMEGYKVTIMAYGQTGSGKTYTMFGPQEVLERFATSDSSLYGCGPRACYQLFTAIEQSPSAAKWRVECTYLEVYNTAVNDLLTGRKNLILRETAEGGLYVDGLSSEVVDNATDAMAALNRGQTNRVVAAMKMNDRSSRGHAIFSVKMRQEGEGRSVQSRLDLVDLAGMESSKKSYAVEVCACADAHALCTHPRDMLEYYCIALDVMSTQLAAHQLNSQLHIHSTQVSRLFPFCSAYWPPRAKVAPPLSRPFLGSRTPRPPLLDFFSDHMDSPLLSLSLAQSLAVRPSIRPPCPPDLLPFTLTLPSLY